MIPVILPAHNEAAVIQQTLAFLLDGAASEEFDVIVACNGCTDATAALARAFEPAVRVLELPVASKTAALNAADAVARGFPRVYVDADVRISAASVRRLVASLEDPGVLLAAPVLRMNLQSTTWVVRCFYAVWMELPYNQTMVGTGAYALSPVGRSRFDTFPAIIADDAFVRFQFGLHERRRVNEAEVWVTPPRSLGGLLKIKTRSRLGGYELLASYPELRNPDPKPPCALLWTLARKPAIWPAIPVYVAINLLTRWRAARHMRRIHAYQWERDDSRSTPPGLADIHV